MIFLIQYDREKGNLVAIREFTDADAVLADESRIKLELKLHELGTDHEVVLLRAPTLEALKLTHRRYFANLDELRSA